MVRLEAVTVIQAPVACCFALSLDLDVELEAVPGLVAVGGVTRGRIGSGERVPWRVRQFGFAVQHTMEISRLEEPRYFQDRMVRGWFRHFAHDHFFEDCGECCTRMRDVLCFSMPWFLGGWVTERLLGAGRMRRLLFARNAVIRRRAEALG